MSKILISGASSGIGLAIAQKLIEANHFVYGLARDFSKTDFNSQNFYKIKCDLRNAEEIESLKKQVSDLDVLINNAGVGHFGLLEKLTTMEIREMLETNLWGTINLTRFFLPVLKEKSGKIINISSESGLKGEKFGTVYCATKFAIRGFSESLLAEVRKENVQVTCIFPGMIDSPFFENKSFQPDSRENCHLSVNDLAEIVLQIINLRKGIVIPEISLSPQIKSIVHK